MVAAGRLHRRPHRPGMETNQPRMRPRRGGSRSLVRVARGGSEAFALATCAAGCVAGPRRSGARHAQALRRRLGDHPAELMRSPFLTPRLQRVHDMLAALWARTGSTGGRHPTWRRSRVSSGWHRTSWTGPGKSPISRARCDAGVARGPWGHDGEGWHPASSSPASCAGFSGRP